MERGFVSRRSVEREPVEGYAKTLQLSLIPSAKLSIYFWIALSIISGIFAYTLQHNPTGLQVHIVLSSCALAAALKYLLRLFRLKKDLRALLIRHPEFKIHDD
jgi:hypothetical protein